MSTTETVVEKAECPKCGADVRPDTQFCYNCGGPVAEEIKNEAPVTNGTAISETVEEKVPAPGLRSAREIKRRERVFERLLTSIKDFLHQITCVRFAQADHCGL